MSSSIGGHPLPVVVSHQCNDGGAGESSVISRIPCEAVSRSFKTVARGAGHGVRMSDIADRYDRLAADFASTIAAVPDDAWDSPSP